MRKTQEPRDGHRTAIDVVMRWLGRLSVVPMLFVWAASHAAVVDINNVPLAQQTSVQVKPNVMFIMDDSGSMDDEHAPDNVSTNNVCFGVATRNRLFYDPNVTYTAPQQANGTNYADASFTAARRDGFNTGSSTRDLSDVRNTSTPAVYTQTGSSSASCAFNWGNCYWGYSTSSSSMAANGIETVTDVSVSCNGSGSSCTRTTTTREGGKFYYATLRPNTTDNCSTLSNYDVVRDVSTLSTVQRTNYANWYSYYRSRVLAMKTGVGRAFGQIDTARFRVGFSTINDTGVTDGNEFLNIRDFSAGTQKADFYSRLYGVNPSSSTPLRPALVKAGRYFANNLTGQTDPVQYSCQRNYSILSTDGYWNTGNEPNSYTPRRLDGTTAIGNLDGGSSVARPMRDSCTASNDGNSCTNNLNGPGVSNTLADIAMYFYETDLRSSALGNCTGSVSGQDVCTDNVRSDGRRDIATHQHMTTFTVGLGVNGVLGYRSDYETATSGSFHDIRQGNAVWPNPVTSSSASNYNSNTVAARIDDVWHAAVNGRGTYFSTNNANDMARDLSTALDRIDQVAGSGAAATTSSLRPSQGDDWLFFATYNTVTWDGNVRAHRIDTGTGAVLNPNAPVWDAATRMAGQGTRSVYMYSSSGSNNLQPFSYSNLGTAQRTSFDNLCLTGSERFSHCATLTANARAQVTGANVVSYLAGTRTYEQSATAVDDRVFRTRAAPLGDIINARPVYVKAPPFTYSENNYATFRSNNVTRQAVLYVASNDGMLHAIKVADDSTGGTELWAYVPSMVMSDMWRLADPNYDTNHRYFVDGSPVVGDVWDGNSWRTILIGGLNAGGRGYYALDITNPTQPRALWEFSVDNDSDLGLTYGNPTIIKLRDGTWAVAFSSGYNNVSPGGGGGHLFLRNAVTGAAIAKISTGAGSSADPSNLGKINAYVPDSATNVARAIYGGDMMGNVWRFDHDDNFGAAGREAFLLAQTTGASQPITTTPTVSVVTSGSTSHVVISVATGRLLGASDLGDTSTQAVYVFRDDFTSTGLGVLPNNAGMVQQILGSDRRVTTLATVDWSTQVGWYVNFAAGERVNVDTEQQYTQLALATNMPQTSPCVAGGTSYLYYFDLATGNVMLTYETNALTAGIGTVELTTGRSVTYQQTVSGRPPEVRQDPDRSTAAAGTMRRTGWRELID
jgi:type IV pilus assembly protein PilY1